MQQTPPQNTNEIATLKMLPRFIIIYIHATTAHTYKS